ncbi:MAG TPA: hypothetical protein VGB37_12025 [Candidatus Lokiarchaeia archaeon]
MELKKTIELILKELRNSSYLTISDFIAKNNLENVKVKELIAEIEKNYNKEFILDINNKEIYSYNLIYNFSKLKLFESLENGNDIDLCSDDFKSFKSQDLIRIFCRIDVEFFDYLLDNI